MSETPLLAMSLTLSVTPQLLSLSVCMCMHVNVSDSTTPEPQHMHVYACASSRSHYVQARYIIMNGGNLEVGHKDAPFPGKARITLWGHPEDRELPQYGSKCIGVRAGNLTLHGTHKEPSWTRLKEGFPVLPGQNSITLEGRTNWAVGDQIVITSSSIYAEGARLGQ